MFKTSDMKQSFPKKHSWLVLSSMMALCVIPSGVFAAGPPVPSEMSKPMAQVLIIIIAVLALMIALLANVVNGAAQLYIEKYKASRKSNEAGSSVKIVSLLFLCLLSGSLFAAEDPATVVQVVDESIGGLSPTSFYALITVLGIEVIILLGLLYNLKLLLAKEVMAVAVVTEVNPVETSFNWSKWWWEKVNSLRPEHEEANIDLGHNYDGIRELDNRLPPWWLYGFYLCILVAGIYIYRYHVSHSAPLPLEELQIAMNAADLEKEEYLKKSANKVDENTVVYMADATSLDAGKKLFTTMCAACHMADGGGSVGPNLTDAYWIHGGGVKDIFKTIKYGWSEKGMKSWKDDYSPVQIAQLTSFIKSLQGTKPAKPKEAQGTLYEEKAVAPAAADSLQPAATKKLTAAN